VQSLKKCFDYLFADGDRHPGAPAVRVHPVSTDSRLQLGNLEVVPIEAWHNRLQVFGYRFGEFAYLTDVKMVEDREIKKIKGVKVLVVNALRMEAHHSHFNLEEALAFAREVGAGTTYFTHISHLMGFHGEVEAKLPKNVHLAYDNLRLKI